MQEKEFGILKLIFQKVTGLSFFCNLINFLLWLNVGMMDPVKVETVEECVAAGCSNGPPTS